MILAVPQASVPGLGQPPAAARRVLIILVGQAGLVVVELDLEVRRGRVEEDDVDLAVEQVGDREEDRLLHARRALQQEVHRAVQAVVRQLADAGQRDLPGRPARGLQLGRRRDAALGDHREDLALDLAPVAPRARHTRQREPECSACKDASRSHGGTLCQNTSEKILRPRPQGQPDAKLPRARAD